MNQTTDPHHGAPAREAARDRAAADPGAFLRRDAILVRQTPVGYLCLGLGEAARTLRFVFDDGAAPRRAFGDLAQLCSALDLEDIVPTPVEGSAAPLGKGDDRYLGRLAAVGSLAKGGYDPDEPRDDHGRWTAVGDLAREISAFFSTTARNAEAGARTAVDVAERGAERTWARTSGLVGAVAEDLAAAERFVAGRGASAIAGVAEFAPESAPEIVAGARAGSAVGRIMGAGGMLVGAGVGALLPYALRNAREQERKLPYRPGLRWQSDGGDLRIEQLTETGDKEIIFAGRPDKDGFYRTENGVVVGHIIGYAGFHPFDEGIATLSARADAAHDGDTPETYLSEKFKTKLAAAVAADDAEGRRRACPARTPENINGRSEQSLAYQEWITNVPRGFDFKIYGVSFDNCIEEERRTEEAKAMRYRKFMPTPDEFKTWYAGRAKLMSQGARQSTVNVAIGFQGDWYFAEEWPADYFRERFKKFPNIRVHWRPPPVPYPWQN